MTRSALDSRNRILAAAEEVFSAKGLRGARVDEIAARAQINKGMLYHYFQSKEDLYAAVLKVNFERVLVVTSRASEGRNDPQEQLVEAIKTYFYFLKENPHFARLMTWEALEDGVYAQKVLPPIWEEGFPRLRAILEEGRSKGVFRSDLDIRQVLTSIHTLCISCFTQKDILAVLWRDDPARPENLEKRLEHILDLILKGILA
ncbi:TetR/AcrR family transcriptional regulator [Moorellaceae bacterium AZ2]